MVLVRLKCMCILPWISREMHMNPDVSICLILDTYVGMQSCIPGMRWR
jgi:hypothetical protein